MTFSLLGRCARTGQFGAVVTTSAIGVGARCPFARAGLGAALTQHRTDPRLGPALLDALAAGMDAAAAMAAVTAATPERDWRQLAVIDAAGRTAHFTGAHVRAERSLAEGRDCIGLGNILATPAVAPAMVAAFEAAPALPLAARLLAAIRAGDAAGGERAAVTSAALLVVHAAPFPLVDLRVDDHPAPLDELARLWALYEPQADDYVRRALAPDSAAAYTPPPAKESPMPATASRADFEALLRRAQLTLTPAQVDDLYGAWPHIERMLEHLRSTARGREAEPSHIFRAEGA